ncbi:MAG: hypothetical protein ACYS9X_29630, partial [Planctomycetota bacterium]
MATRPLSPRSGSRRRIGAAAGLFIVSLVVLTGLGLFLTRAQVREWREVFVAKGGPPGKPTRAAIALLRTWADARAEPPEAVKALDGRHVEILGFARPLGDARGRPGVESAPTSAVERRGMWLFEDPIFVAPSTLFPREVAVWAAMPEGEPLPEEIELGSVVRACGTLRVGHQD